MRGEIQTTITLFFAILGGTLLFKSEVNISEEAFIALFEAVLLTFANGIRVNWSTDKTDDNREG